MTEENLYLRYLPWLEESDTIIITLKAMGLSHRNITKILCGGEAIIDGDITSPYTGQTLQVVNARISLNLKQEHTPQLMMDDLPLQDGLQEWVDRDALMKQMAVDDEVVAQVYQENLELRRKIGALLRTYR
jgi:hypothetical protein